MSLFTDIPDGLDIITDYDEVDGMVQHAIYNGYCIVTAHTNTGKYSIGMLRVFIEMVDFYGIVITELKYKYLVDFYSKHSEVTKIEDNIYVIKGV